MSRVEYTESDIQQIKAEAWDEGRKHGARYPYGKRGLGSDDNPYRTKGATMNEHEEPPTKAIAGRL